MKTPVYSWGFSFERTQAYQKQAEELKLAAQPQWIKLGHYKKKFYGYKSGFSDGFFVSPKGPTSPADELRASIELLYSNAETYIAKNKEHPQCYYLARTQWLNKVLHTDSQDQIPCPEKTAWKKDLNAQSVSLIFAAGDLSNAASIFGHTFLKINNPQNKGQKDLLNYGIDYSADADASEGFFYAVKGLFGFYNGHFAMLPFHQKILTYTNVEGRDIWEFKLNFSPEETEFLINHLLEMEKAGAPYYFADDNCSTQILRTLEVVRPQLNLADRIQNFVVPIETVKLIEREGSTVDRVIYKPALKTEFLKAYRRLDDDQKNYFPLLVQNLNFSKSEIEFSKLQKAQLLETAAAELSLKSFKTNTDLEVQKYQLYLQRIELGPGIATNTAKPIQPTQTHDSAGIIMGMWNDGIYFKWRGAFHELEQPHDGLIPHSHIEAISLSTKLNTKTKAQHFGSFTLLNVINLNPSNSLENNLAWKAHVEFLDRFQPDLEGGLGSSFAVTSNDELRFSAFLTGRYWKTDRDLTAAGPEILISYHPWNSLGLSLSETYFLVNRHDDYLRSKLKLNWQFTSQWDFKVSYENFISALDSNSLDSETLMAFGYNFIF